MVVLAEVTAEVMARAAGAALVVVVRARGAEAEARVARAAVEKPMHLG